MPYGSREIIWAIMKLLPLPPMATSLLSKVLPGRSLCFNTFPQTSAHFLFVWILFCFLPKQVFFSLFLTPSPVLLGVLR